MCRSAERWRRLGFQDRHSNDWYGRYQDGGIEALKDGKPKPQRVWNKIPEEIGAAIVNRALEKPDLSPRELAVNFTDTKASFVSEASVYRSILRVERAW